MKAKPLGTTVYIDRGTHKKLKVASATSAEVPRPTLGEIIRRLVDRFLK